ncbi:CDGP domain-containing protein [Mycolicibacterium mageritense]
MIKTLTAAVVIGAATMVFAPSAGAAPGCESVPWGFLGSQVRTLCDGPMMADGSWMRARVIWVPAHQVPFTCSYSRYSSSCSGGLLCRRQGGQRGRVPGAPRDGAARRAGLSRAGGSAEPESGTLLSGADGTSSWR